MIDKFSWFLGMAMQAAIVGFMFGHRQQFIAALLFIGLALAFKLG